MSEQSISEEAGHKPRKTSRSKNPQKRKSGSDKGQMLRRFPTMLVPLELRHHLTAKSLERNYPFFLAGFVRVSAALRRADIAKSAETVQEFIAGVIAEAAQDIKKTRELLEEHITDENQSVQKTIAEITRQEVQVPNSVAREYLRLYEETDDCIDHVYCAAILGCISEEQKHDLLEEIKRTLQRPTSCYSRLRAKLEQRMKSIDQKSDEAKNEMLILLQQIIEEDPTRETS